ncbi:hypothetical protein GQ600_24553 [Phytophthora cactorum]|nr:hypothetical protein GQ600_24553 [Phytophthora cactorum]
MDSLIDFSFSLICSSDRKLHLHTIICSALSKKRTHWPDIVLLNCWPHLARNLPRRKHLLTTAHRYEGILKPQVHYLHKARNAAQC